MNLHLTLNDPNFSHRMAVEHSMLLSHQEIHEGSGEEPEKLRNEAYIKIKSQLDKYFIQGNCLKLTLNTETGELTPVKLML